ncbi:hypothetical protein DICPUDRAFT_49593 [Dictyostelium purpureum]|uniref:Alpha-mannosidase n=1 Tax=Dictyostelium purpureum TaxID=5786 RepID=F0ZUC9_DICPU|nr:uncharacterized protein DICPUDRAFT_49593 [Dictyostelium purpureum]EGC32455.1 hypothetical protein DICPUDRAFT_49593 [Dictyostelium purpureum]|eukprot:XP_003291027.1 hypothetical protein DICPUDRAFT_49593 [Dictyostelium purpureum]
MKDIKKILFSFIIFFIIFGVISSKTTIKNSNKKQEPKLSSTLLNVHIVPHTHDDVGWLKTVDEYYSGTNMSISFTGVQYVLDNAVSCLLQNPERKFIYVEIAFFQRWWNEQTPTMQNLVKGLVESGQLEFINGGYCMNDEATTYYDDIIDQMTVGHQFLWENFGVMPKIGWHIDPFGHSSTQAAIFGAMGFDAFIVGRIDYQDIGIRLQDKQMEFMWRSSKSNPDDQIFTSVLRAMYCTPNGFDFENGDDPIQDDPNLFGYNVEQRASAFVEIANEYATHFRSNNVLIPFGCDFQYLNANMYFKNIDKLIEHINASPEKYGLNLIYSTPSIYIDAVNKAGLTWNVKTDDFFPYADDAFSYWTGYFVSRPALKGYVRQNNALLHMVEQMLVTSSSFLTQTQSSQLIQDIMVMRQAMGVAQHHDAVSGTEKQEVADDYAERLSIGNAASLETINTVIGKLLTSSSKSKNAATPNLSFCPLLNQSICPATNPLSEGSNVPVIFYNSLSWTRYEHVRVPIPVSNVSVSSTDGPIPSQVINYNSSYILEFYALVSPLGYSTYVISPVKGEENERPAEQVYETIVTKENTANPIVFENKYISAQFNPNDGSLISITNVTSGATLNIQQEYVWYQSSDGNYDSTQCSGAYIFRPNEDYAFKYNNITPIVTVAQGPISSSIRIFWSDIMVQTFRLYTESEHLEVEEIIGPIDISDNLGKEVVSRYTTDLSTDNTWYSDSNGMEMQKRITNYRPSWNYTVVQPTSGNYVPVNAITYIQDTSKNLQFTVLTDRSRSSASLRSGQLDVMMHRRTLMDDGRGVGQPMNESTQIITTSKLIFHDISEVAQSHYRPTALGLAHPLYPMFTSTQQSSSQWNNQYTGIYSPVDDQQVPTGIKIQTLQWLDDQANSVLLRIENIYQIDDQDKDDPKTISVDISSIFTNLSIASITEMNLTGVQKITNINRLNWNTVDNFKPSPKSSSPNSNVYSVSPMQIRTFVITFN